MDTVLMGNWLYTWVCSVVEFPCYPKNDKALGISLEGSSQTQQINGQTLSDATLFRQYPYFLPCIVAASISAASWLVTLVFLKEVHEFSYFTMLSLWRLFFFSRHAAPHLKRNP